MNDAENPAENTQEGGQEEDPVAAAFQGMQQSVEADMKAADVIEHMGSKEAADMFRQAGQLKTQALQVLQGGGGGGQTVGAGNPDTAGAGSTSPVGMNTK